MGTNYDDENEVEVRISKRLKKTIVGTALAVSGFGLAAYVLEPIIAATQLGIVLFGLVIFLGGVHFLR